MIYVIKTLGSIYDSEGDRLIFLKIGKTKKIEQRLKAIQTGCPFNLKCIFTYDSDRDSQLEDYLHQYFREFNTQGEWFVINHKQLSTFKKDVIKAIQHYFLATSGSVPNTPFLTDPD